tara:strand:+ start:1350 stop:1616 length:267 start_codon:yes stop_codon:yes gene_type:complete
MNQFLIIFIILAIISIVIYSFLFLAWSAKKTLLKGTTTWSAKNLPIKRSKKYSNKEGSSSLLESISIQTREYLISEKEEEGKATYKDK